MWLFGWHENSGGSFKAAINVLYRNSKKQQIVSEYNSTGNDNPERGKFLGYGAYYYQIEKLKSKKNLYLRLGNIIGCNSCCSQIAAVIELDGEKINFDYPAFEKENADQPEFEPAFTLDSRCGAISKFEYDLKSQRLVYEYEPNDLTPVTDDEPGKTIGRAVFWDGSRFTATPGAK